MRVDWDSANDAAQSALVVAYGEIERRHLLESGDEKDDLAVLTAAILLVKVAQDTGQSLERLFAVVQAANTLSKK